MTKTNEFKNNSHLQGPLKVRIIFEINRFGHFCVFGISGRSGVGIP